MRWQLGLDLADQAVDGGGGNRALGAGDADAAEEFFAVKLLAGAVFFDDQRGRQQRALDGGEALLALDALAAAANYPAIIMGRV